MSTLSTDSDLITTGRTAPDFILPDSSGTPVHLAELRGGPVLIVFFPFAFSRVCHSELAGLSERAEDFDDIGAVVLAISCDSMHSLRAWSEQEEFELPFLSDYWPHGKVSAEYGALDAEAGHPVRASVLIDAEGVVSWTTVSPPGQARSVTDHLQAVQALTSAGPGAR